MKPPNNQLDPNQLIQLLASDGQLTRSLKGFEPRLAQQHMMENVINAYNHDCIALIEAGTGTGKSLAYLIPAILWALKRNEKTVISTHTIALQEQLIEKDIPTLLQALNLTVKAVLVKGISNYLCLRKLNDSLSMLQLFPGAEQKEIEAVDKWLPQAKEGSRSEIPFIATAATWDLIGAESEACSNNACPYYQECYFFKARRKAQDAQLLIANHHLLFADLAKRKANNNYTDPCILPPYSRIILDEAHHIESIASDFFSASLNRLELLRILSRLNSDKKTGAAEGKLPILREKLHQIYGKAPSQDIGQLIRQIGNDLSNIRNILNEQIHSSFDSFCTYIESKKKPWERSPLGDSPSRGEYKLRILKDDQSHLSWKEQFEPFAQKLIDELKRYQVGLDTLEGSMKIITDEKFHEQTKGIRLDISALNGKLLEAIEFLKSFLDEVQTSSVRWVEIQQLKTMYNLHLIDAELNISKLLADHLFNRFSTVVLCSATLTTNHDFKYTRQRLGLTDDLLEDRSVTEHVYTSPFDFQRQTLLAIPMDMPPPNHPEFNDIAFENIWKAIETSRGGTFVLFTSYAMMQACHDTLVNRLAEHRYTLFRQGDDHRLSLLNKFKKTDRAVLFGTDTFWEGVDVAGDALRCVIIVKLPFQVPNEPIVQAQTEAILAQGGNPFNDYMVPQAIVKFKQGFGRLIRTKYDRGSIICLDTRLGTKSYGQQFLNSLPPTEKLFTNSTHLWPKIADFYKRTYHYVQQSPF